MAGAMLLACVGMWCSANSPVPRPSSIGGPRTSDTPVFSPLLPAIQNGPGTRPAQGVSLAPSRYGGEGALLVRHRSDLIQNCDS